MKTTLLLLIGLMIVRHPCAGGAPPSPQYSRHDSPWRPGLSEPPLALNKAFEAAAQIQQLRPGRFPWCLDDVRIPGSLAKGGPYFYEYQFRFSRQVRWVPHTQREEREECLVAVDMTTGKLTIGDIRPQK